MSIIIPTWEAEIGRIAVPGSGAKSSREPSQSTAGYGVICKSIK
jgi:hypothetical protein